MYNSAMQTLPVAPPPPTLRSLASPWARTLLTGHRGAAAYEPGNTLASFERAIAMGADVLECDVRATRDGTLVLAHDAIIGRGRAVTRIGRATAAQLRKHRGAVVACRAAMRRRSPLRRNRRSCRDRLGNEPSEPINHFELAVVLIT